MKLLLLDNYDSFTYNIVHVVRKLGYEIDVVRNDKISVAEVAQYDKIILSPGPGIPEEAGILLPLIKEYASTKPILGVCLGHQAIGEAFGASLINLSKVYHGVSSMVSIQYRDSIFEGLPDTLEVGRYHSWVINPATLPSCLRVTAVDEGGQIMAIAHTEYDVHGVQFHPESILTPQGETIIKNFLK